MLHTTAIPACGPAFGAMRPDPVPAELRIPAPPFARWIPPRREPAWREAMRWSLIGLTASLAAGEVALALLG